MKNLKIITLIFTLVLSSAAVCSASGSSAADILRSGLLGAGAGAIGGAVSGGDSDNLWISALTGAGVNIVGGSLLDVITEGGTSSTAQSRAIRYNNNSSAYDRRYRQIPQARESELYKAGYEQGYSEGFKAGYLKAYKEAYKKGYQDGLLDRI